MNSARYSFFLFTVFLLVAASVLVLGVRGLSAQTISDPVGDQVGPSYLDVVSTTVERSGDSLVFSMEVSSDIPPSPFEYHAFIWFVDADNNPSTGMVTRGIGSDYNVRIFFDPNLGGGMWFGAVDINNPPGGVSFTSASVSGTHAEIRAHIPELVTPPVSFPWYLHAWSNSNQVGDNAPNSSVVTYSDTVTWYVKPDGSGDAATIQAAIDLAQPGDTVLLAPGTYVGPGNRDIEYNGKAITVKSEAGAAATIIDCEGEAGEYHRGFIFDSAESQSSVLKGVTVKNGYHEGGGAVWCSGASPRMIECVFADNTGWSVGGAVRCQYSSQPILESCTLVGNSSGVGGGIYCSSSSRISLMSTIIAFSVQGEGVYLEPDAPYMSVVACNIYGNEGGDWGSGIANLEGTWANISADPLFCNADEGVFSVRSDSPCLPPNNPGGVLIGALGVGCEPQTTWHVNPSGTGDAPSIQAAIDLAANGDVILMADGTYTADYDKNLDFKGKAITLRSESGNPAACVIDCQGSGRGAAFISGEGPGASIRDITIKNGFSSQGGAVLCVGASPTIMNCLFLSNNATHGGSIYIESSAPVIESCTFLSATASQGGAICCGPVPATSKIAQVLGLSITPLALGDARIDNSIELVDCSFSQNTGDIGGAVMSWNGASSATGCVFYDNSGWTGAMTLSQSLWSVIGCTFAANNATMSFCGSSLYLEYCNPVIENTLMAYGVGSAPAVACLEGIPTLSCSNVYGNAGGDWVGCIAGQDGANGNLSADPRFCDVTSGDLTVRENSPSLPPNNSCSVQIGAFGQGCGFTAWYLQPDGSGDAPTIQAAVNAALPGDTIILACGTYVEHDVAINTSGLYLKSETGSPACATIDAQSSGCVLRFTDVNAATVINGITLANGRAAQGGGAWFSNSDPIFMNCRFEDCVATDDGGGIHCIAGSSPTFTSCVFDGNSAADNGGMLCCRDQSNPSFDFCSILGCSAVYGGGAYCYESSPSFETCIFANNTATQRGGATYFYQSTSTLTSCTFFANSCTDGAGIYCIESSPTVANTIIASSPQGQAVSCQTGCGAVFTCSDLFANAGGDWVGCIAAQEGVDGNITADPHFCDAGSDNFTIRNDSPCLPANNDCAALIGALGEGCTYDGPSFTQIDYPDLTPANGYNIAPVDYDADGDLDLALGAHILEQVEGGSMQDDTGTGIPSDFLAYAYWADIDNDGFEDAAMCYRGVQEIKLYRNLGDGTFEDITASSGFGDYAAAGAWVDYNRDGYVDFFCFDEYAPGGGYGDWGHTILLKNNGDLTFEDVTAAAGLALTESKVACAFFDCDNDGDDDLYITGLWAPARFFENLGDGTFDEVTDVSAITILRSQGIGVGDYDNDGYLDLLVNIYEQTYARLFRNTFGDNGQIGFQDVTTAAAMVGPTGIIGRSAALQDFDNDGRLDGFLAYQAGHDYLWHALADGTFEEISIEANIGGPGNSNAAATADFDGNGYLDVVTKWDPNTPSWFYQNDGGPNHWLQLDLAGNGVTTNRSAIGAFVTIEVGGETQVRQVIAGSSYRCEESRILSFGLGSYTTVDRIEIRWPDGVTQELTNVAADQKLAIEQGTTDLIPPETALSSGPSPDDVTCTSTVSFSWTGTDNLTPPKQLVYAYELDALGFSSFSGDTSVSYTGLADGPHVFIVKARDLAGNEDLFPDTLRFVTDGHPPTVAITFGPAENEHISQSEVEFHWRGSDLVTPPESLLYVWDLDGTQSTLGTRDTVAVFTLWLYEGTHEFNLAAYDQCDHYDGITRNFVIDRTPPVPVIATGPQDGGCWPSSTVGFSWSGTDNLAPAEALEYSYAFDSETFGTWTSNTTAEFPASPPGPHYFKLKTRDKAGNETAEPITVSFTVGDIDLLVSDAAVPDSAYCAREATIEWVVQNDGSCPVTEPWFDAFYLSADSAVGIDDVLMTELARTDTLAPGGSMPRITDVFLPDNIEGRYHIIVETNSRGGVLEEGHGDNNTYISQSIAVTRPPHPDLVVTNVMAPDEGWSGQGIHVEWTVQNVGNAPAEGAWVEHVYLSDDMTLDGGDPKLSQFNYTYGLGVGESYTHIHPVTLPPTAEGDFWIFVCTNAGGSVNEYDHAGNNCTISENPVQIHLTPYPNLVVTGVDAPSAANSDDEIEISWTVSNTGGVSTSAPIWYDKVYLSPTTEPGGYVLGEFENLSYLAPGESYARQNQTVTIPKQVIDGTYYIVVKTDSRDNVDEQNNEGDNVTASSSLPVQYVIYDRPDLAVTNFVSSFAGWAGNPISLGWTVTNQGTAAASGDPIIDWVWLSTDSVIDPHNAAHIGGSYVGTPLQPGQSYERSVNITLPDTADGKYYLYVWTDVDLNFDDPDLDNNFSEIRPLLVRIPPPADLVVDPQITASQDTVFAGGSVVIQWTVRNEGAGPGHDSVWRDAIYLSTDDVLDTNEDVRYAKVFHSGFLEPGGYYTGSQSIAIPGEVSGTRYIFVCTDVDNDVFEGDFEDNNCEMSVQTLEVVVPPPVVVDEFDLRVTAIGNTGTPWSGAALGVTWTVKNFGPDAASGDWLDHIYLSADSLLSLGADPLLASVSHTGGLSINGTYSSTRSVLIPNGTSGRNFILVQTDAGNAVYEPNHENDNVTFKAIQVNLTPPPDLQVVELLAPPDTLVSGQASAFQWQVKNTGPGATIAQSWMDYFYLSADTVLNVPGDTYLTGFFHSGALAAGQFYQDGRNITIPSGVSGERYVIAWTDANNTVYEYGADGNNTRWVRIIAKTLPQLPPPDLAMESLSFIDGDRDTISYSVRNISGQNIPSAERSWTDRFYLSMDDILVTSQDALVGSFNYVGDLGPGADYSRTRQVTLPPGAEGDFYLFGVTDATERVTEVGDANNTLIIPIHVALTPPDLRVASVSGADSLPAGQPASVSWTVENTGIGLADPAVWYDGVYLSPDQILDETDELLGSRLHTNGLSPGGAYAESLDVMIPPGLSGRRYFFVKTDKNDNVFEHNGESNNTAYDAGGVEIFIPPANSDLVVSSVSMPANGVSGDSVTINWTVSNQSSYDLEGQWRDAVYVSPDTVWNLDDYYLGDAIHTAGLGAGMKYTQSLSIAAEDFNTFIESVLPGVEPGGYRMIVRCDVRNNINEYNEINNTGASANDMTMDLAPLAMDTPTTSQVAYRGREYFKLEVPAGVDVKFILDTVSPYDEIEMYVRYGEVPDRLNYEYKERIKGHHEFMVPGSPVGDCYILVYGDYVPGTGEFTILPESFVFGIYDVQPDSVDNTGFVTFSLSGGQLGAATAVELRLAGVDTIPAWDVEVVNTTLVRASFDLRGVDFGGYDLVLTTSGPLTTELPAAVDVLPGAGAVVDPEIRGPDTIRQNAVNSFLVVLHNTGDADAYDVISGLTLDAGVSYQLVSDETISAPTVSDGTRALLYTNSIGAGASEEITVRVWGRSDLTIDVLPVNTDPTLVQAESKPAVLSAWVNAEVEAFADRLAADAIFIDRALFRSLHARSWTDLWTDDAGAPRTGALDDRVETAMLDALTDLNDPQVPAELSGITPLGITAAVDEAETQYADAANSGRFKRKKKTVTVRVAEDPNEKLGPLGPGGENFVSQVEDVPYTIYFENMPDAAAAAQQVVVIDNLTDQFDYRKFRLGEIAFGGTIIDVPQNLSYYHTRVDLESGYLLEIDAGIDVTTGEALWMFNTIDPSTGLPPLDPAAGFLPPNDSLGVGQGHVQFTIKTDPDVLDGTELRNKALIVFDGNDPIETAEVLNVVQRVPPDLLVSAFSGQSGYPYFVEGEDITVNATISNPTDAATGAFSVAFYDGDPGAGGLLIDSTRVVGVGANSDIQVQATWLPLRILDRHEIHIEIDTQDEIAELDETNNTHVLVLDPEPKTYAVDLSADINLVAIPLEPATPYTARTLAELLGASLIIRYDTATELFEPYDSTGGMFDAFIPAQNGDGFDIESGKGYIAVLGQPKQVTFTGITQFGAVGVQERLNFVSLPLQPAAPFTARSYCEKLDANMVIRYVNSTGRFDAFIPEFHSGEGFEILGARGYLAYANRDTTVEFDGKGWFGQQNAPPGGYSPPATAGGDDDQPKTPVLGLVGRLSQRVWDDQTPLTSEFSAVVKNTRTGTAVPVRIRNDTGEFAGAFVDLTNNAPVQAGDVLEMTVFEESGKPVGHPIETTVSEDDINKRYIKFNAVLTGMAPRVSRLYQNFPNPFNPQTMIRYQLAKRGAVSIRVYNVAGQLVRTLLNEPKSPGFYQITWDGTNDRGVRVASGVYFYRLNAPEYTQSMKMVVLK